MSLLGPYLIACFLLVIAGLAKLLRPLPTAVVLSQVSPSLRSHPERLTGAVRVFSLLEASLGVAGALYPRPLEAAVVAISFGAFGLFVLFVRIRGGMDAGCGCFATPDSDDADGSEGSESAPATGFHVFIDIALACAAVVVAIAGLHGTIVSLLAKQRLDGVPLVAGCAAGTWLVSLWMSALPSLSRARRLVEQFP